MGQFAGKQDVGSVIWGGWIIFFDVWVAGVGHKGGADMAFFGDGPEMLSATGGQEPVELASDLVGGVGETIEGIFIPADEFCVGQCLAEAGQRVAIEVSKGKENHDFGLIVGQQSAAMEVGFIFGEFSGDGFAANRAEFEHQVSVADGEGVVADLDEALLELAGDDLHITK